jgi:hypothetical protein
VEKKNNYIILLTLVISLALLLQIVSANEPIRPANQMQDRGVDRQIRPANQMDQSSEGNGGYKPTEGSTYSSRTGGSSNHDEAPILTNMKSDLIEVDSEPNASAQGNANIAVDTKNNLLEYNISIFELSSEETGAHINGPKEGLLDQILFDLPLGMNKIGLWNYDESLEQDLLSGNTYINIHSIIFPLGELTGKIITI